MDSLKGQEIFTYNNNMPQPLSSTYFVKQPQFRFRLSSVFIFIAAALVAWVSAFSGQTAFPSQNLVPYIFRTAIILIIDLALIYVSFRLLKQNNLSKEALGLNVSKKAIADILRGALIGILSIATIAAVLFLYVPYHFVTGPLSCSQAFQEISSYVLINSLEELMFRGFLFIICCQLAGWRLSVLIMALPFGLFHLQGTGFNMNGLKMFATTACYSFVFSLSYVLFRSMWASISVHVVSNFLLHTVTGLDGANRALLMPVFEKDWPKGYDTGLTVFIFSTVIISGLLFLLIILSGKKLRSTGRPGLPNL